MRVGSKTVFRSSRRELPGMAHDEHRDLSINGLQLLKRSNDKHSRFTHARFSLADDIHPQNSLRDALILHCNEKTKTGDF